MQLVGRDEKNRQVGDHLRVDQHPAMQLVGRDEKNRFKSGSAALGLHAPQCSSSVGTRRTRVR